LALRHLDRQRMTAEEEESVKRLRRECVSCVGSVAEMIAPNYEAAKAA
jgi:hypothetical protein